MRSLDHLADCYDFRMAIADSIAAYLRADCSATDKDELEISDDQ